MNASEPAKIYRYATAGVLNTATAYAVFALLLFVGFHFAAATLVGGLAGMLMSYWLNAKWVFRYRGGQRYGPFVLLFASLYAMNITIQKATMTVWGADGYIAGAIGTAFTAAVGYFVSRGWGFVDTPCATRTTRNSL